MQFISPSGISSSSAFGTNKLIRVYIPFPIQSQEQFGTPRINWQVLILSSINTQEIFGSHQIYRQPNQIKSVSPYVKNQVPDYARTDFPRFVEFLSKYYEWMEIRGNALGFMKDLISYQDVDSTRDPFLQSLQKEVMRKFPKDLYVDPSDPNNRVNLRNIIKHIVQFYGSKGTEKSFEFLFRAVLGVEVDFYYPRVDMLRPSDGKWIQNYSIRVTSTTDSSEEPFVLSGKKIFGTESLSTAFVEFVVSYRIGFQTVYELFLNRSTVSNQFYPGEIIISEEVQGVKVVPSSVVTGFKFYDRGSTYGEGSRIRSNFNQFGVQEIEGVVATVNNKGNVLAVNIVSPGFDIPLNAFSFVNPNDRNYQGILTYEPDGDEQLHVIPQIGTIIKYPGYFLNDDGKLSDAKYIQDSDYYQQFSYVLKVSESIDRYRSLVQDIIHPAGLKMFGNFVSDNFVDGSFTGSGEVDLEWANSVQYEYPTEVSAEMERVIELDPNIEPEYDEYQLQTVVTYRSGASLNSIDRFKFTYKPNGQGNDETRMNHILNVNYWASDFANYQIKDFFDIKVGDFWQKPWIRTKIQPEPVLRTTTSPATETDNDVAVPLPP